MKKTTSYLLATLALCSLSSDGWANRSNRSCYEEPSCCYDECEAYVPPCSSCECDEGPSSMWLSARHREANGIGYPTGYTSLDFLYTHGWGCNWYSFLDLRGHLANNGKWATNAGIGVRYLDDCCPIVYGLNFFWDWREASHFNYHQLGGGLEFLWPLWDIRLNGYAPLSLQKKTYKTAFEKFQGNQAFFEKKEELSMWGIDGALGYWLYNEGCFGIHTALGGYYFQGKSKELYGGLFRAKVRLTDFVTLEGQASYDTEFKWLGQAELAFNLSFGPKVKRAARNVASCCDLLALEYRLVEQVTRFEIPVTTTKKSTTVALDPTTGAPLTFYFVDNTSNSLGTFESPYPTLAQAQAASSVRDVIYIFPGDGTTTGMDQGITLKSYQSLVGSGAPFTVATRFGTLEIPAQTTALPKITNSLPNAVVTFSDNSARGNLISGLNITSKLQAIKGAEAFDLTVQYSQVNFLTNSLQSPGVNAAFTGAIQFDKSIDNFLCKETTIFTIGPYRSGILSQNFYSNLTFENSFITTSDTYSDGINISSFQGNNLTFENSFITTSDTYSDGIKISSFQGNDFSINNSSIRTKEADSYGVNITNFDGTEFSITNSSISTPKGYGVFVKNAVKGRDFKMIGSTISSLEYGFHFGSYNGRDILIENSQLSNSYVDLDPAMYVAAFNGRTFTVRNTSVLGYQGIQIDSFSGKDFILETTSILAQASGVKFTTFNGRDVLLNDCSIQSRIGLDFQEATVRNLKCTNSSFKNIENTIDIDSFSGENFLFRNSSVSSQQLGIRISSFAKGSLTVQDSNISTESSSVAIENNFSDSSILIERNTITSKQGKGIEIAQPSADTQMIIQNNQIAAYQEALRVYPISGNLRADILNNRFISNGDTPSFFPAVHLTTEESGQLRLRYWKNTAVSKAVSGGSDVFFENKDAVFQVESPNLEQTGLEALNDGTFELTDITFIPFE